MSANRVRHHDIVRNLLASKAIDFAALGQVVSDLGPSIAVLDEPWEAICGTMRTFIRVYQIQNPGTPLENLAELGAAAGELKA